MPKTLGTLATAVRDSLDESTASFWTDAQVRKAINEGTREIARYTSTIEKTGTIAVSAGTQTYTGVPSDMLQINRVEFVKTGDTAVYVLGPRQNNEMDPLWGTSKAQSQGTPQWFTAWGYTGGTMTLTLYPTPSDAGTLTLYYYAVPADLSTSGSADSTNVTCPEGWEDLIVFYAIYRCLQKDADPTWKDYKALYDEKLQSMLELTRQVHDQEGFMNYQPYANAFGGWW